MGLVLHEALMGELWLVEASSPSGTLNAKTVLPRGVRYVASSSRVLAVRCLQRVRPNALKYLTLSEHIAIVVSQCFGCFISVWKTAGWPVNDRAEGSPLSGTHASTLECDLIQSYNHTSRAGYIR